MSRLARDACPVLNSRIASPLLRSMAMMMLCAPEGAWSDGASLPGRILESSERPCPNCSSPNTKPLSFNANAEPFAVYACRACAHVWRLGRPARPESA